MTNKIHISWKDYGILIEELINKVKGGMMQFDGVFGIPRGGAPIALAFSHALDIPVLLYPTSHSLIVDDLSDTGATLQGIKNKRIATLHSTKWTKVMPDYWVDEKLNEDDWIVYPYEND